MALFKCKMCGGTLEIDDKTVATCEYCGTQQTLPRLNDDRKANLYDRANHFRRNNEFDKAMGIYEKILTEDTADAEAYWSLVLCRYGIEYVEDPATRKRMPTVNRAQFTSIFDDNNYKSALQYADSHQRSVYEEEAKAINEIQKGILAISQKEEPFDIFICYKETDANGRRTPDSVLAQELYFQLTQEGFKVFFSRITLEDKLGSAYEPYIFAALNSAKVMVVLGTRAEYFNAVWVKNEWSRYLSLIKNGAKKMLIPAYRDMDPYDLPEEFSHLQAQDMSKLGFMQDLIRGIKKIVQTEEPKAHVIQEPAVTAAEPVVAASAAPLLRRAFMFLEDGDWNAADEYCEKVLDIEPECAEAYLGKLMAECRVKKQESLKEQVEPFDHRNNYRKAIRFADEKLKTTLVGYIEHINARNESARLDSIYTRAKNAMSVAHTEGSYKEAAELFKSIRKYKDSAALAQMCYKKAEVVRKDAVLAEAKSKMSGEVIYNYESAMNLFESISGWKDADEQIVVCRTKIEQLIAKAEIAREEAERIAKQNQKTAAIIMSVILAFIAVLVVLTTVIIPNGQYNDAVELMNAGQYNEAASIFSALNGYKDSVSKEKECKYNSAMLLLSEENIIDAYEILATLGGYKDSVDKANSIYFEYQLEKMKVAKAGEYVFFGTYEQDNNIPNGGEAIEWLVLEVKEEKVLLISRYALDCKPYNTIGTDITWDTCSLRKWLNNGFIKEAFSDDEKAMIHTVTVSADKTLKQSANPGKDTQDRVFLLSIKEANKYFSSNSISRCTPTDYADANGAWKSDSGNCWWWLRSPGSYQKYASVVDGDGDKRSCFVDDRQIAVRPALWINLNS